MKVNWNAAVDTKAKVTKTNFVMTEFLLMTISHKHTTTVL